MSFFGFRERKVQQMSFFSQTHTKLFTSWHCDAAVPEFMPPPCHHSYADTIILTRHIVLNSPHKAFLSVFLTLSLSRFLSFSLPPLSYHEYKCALKNPRHHRSPFPLSSPPSLHPSIHPSLLPFLHCGVIGTFNWIYNHLSTEANIQRLS